MVSRIEIRPKGGDWTFERNLMPGNSCGIADPLMDGGEEIISVSCDEHDAATSITRLKAGDFYEDPQSGEVCILKKDADFVLRLGDPPYETLIQSQINSDKIGLRIAHRDVF